MCQTALAKEIKKWVVNDYFTPNIKAEVILDTLLTPYIAQILKNQLSIHAELLAKEMSIKDINGSTNRGAKIDYVLEDTGTVYLVELKTTKGSINSNQAERYTDNCYEDGKVKTFGQALGAQLLDIVGDKFKSKGPWTPENLSKAFRNVTRADKGEEGAKPAEQFLKQNGLASTHKYLYTIGQILEHHPKAEDIQKLWQKGLKLVYLTPYGDNIISDSFFSKKGIAWNAIYRGPKGPRSSISLRKAIRELQPEPGDEEFVKLLQSIIKEIYPEKEMPSCQN